MARRKRRPANDRAFKKYKSESSFRKNKQRKLEKHCKLFPDDKQAAKALEKGNFTYSRKKPSKIRLNKGKVTTAATVKYSPNPIIFPQTPREQLEAIFRT